MDILILGGTVFVGRGAAEAALARNHRVTLFHRGSKGTGIVSGAEDLLGDRDGGLDALEGRKWDAVIDACGYVPRLVGDAARALREATNRFLFVSTISVYEDDGNGGLRERPVPQPVGTEEITGETYGPLKVECEREVNAVFGDRATIVRPGLVYGPYDPTGRFPYWVRRFIDGGEILVPAIGNNALQQIDARDLGLFMIHLLEADRSGVFDAVGEDSTFGEMIAACGALNPDAHTVEASISALEGLGVKLGAELPLAYGDGPLMRIDPAFAVAAGLERRPLSETAADTAAWLRSSESTERPIAGMTRDREREILTTLGN